jgi:hypothetical protein
MDGAAVHHEGAKDPMPLWADLSPEDLVEVDLEGRHLAGSR